MRILFALITAALIASAALAQRVAIFNEPGFPAEETTPLLLPQTVRDWLEALNIKAEFVNARQLADPKSFNKQKYLVLILPYGSGYPANAEANLKRFRSAGGSIAAPGVPLSRPADPVGAEGWLLRGPAVVRQSGQAAEGKFAIQIQLPLGQPWAGLESAPFPFKHSGPTRLAARVRAERTTAEDRLIVRFLGAKGLPLGEISTGLNTNPGQFHPAVHEFETPSGTETARIELRLRSPRASAIIDDISLTPLPDGKPAALPNPSFETPGGGWRLRSEEVSQGIPFGAVARPDEIETARLRRSSNDPLKLTYLPALNRGGTVLMRPGAGDRALPIFTVVDGERVLGHAAAIVQRTAGPAKGAWDFWVGGDLWLAPDHATLRALRTVLTAGVLYQLQKLGGLNQRQYNQAAVRVFDLYQKSSLPQRTATTAGLMLPKQSRPNPTLDWIDARTLGDAEALTVVTLQGLVNRQRPRLFVVWSEADERLLGRLSALGEVSGANAIRSVAELVEKYKSEIGGRVIPPHEVSLAPNIAAMAAAARNGIVTPPNADYGLTTLLDLRNRFKTNAQALDWARANLNLAATLGLAVLPPDRTGFAAFDYFVANRLPILWASGPAEALLPGVSPADELSAVEAWLPRAGGSIAADWGDLALAGVGRRFGAAISSWHGLPEAPAATAPNQSALSGFALNLRPGPRANPPRFDATRAYVTVIVGAGPGGLSSGPAWPALTEAREDNLLGIGIGPASFSTHPGLVTQLSREVNPQRRLALDLSNVLRLELFGGANPGATVQSLAAQAAGLMSQNGLRLAVLPDSPDGPLTRFLQQRYPELRAVFALGQTPDDTVPSRNAVRLGEAVAINTITYRPNPTDSPEAQTAALTALIRRHTTGERPAFLALYLPDGAVRPLVVSQALTNLGTGYERVAPNDFVELLLNGGNR